MRKYLILFVLISFDTFAASEQEEIELLEYYKYKFPLAVCLTEDYRKCYGGISVEKCVSQMNVNRTSCNIKLTSSEIETSNRNFGEYTQCMFFKHAGVKTIDEVKDHCIAKIEIDLSKSNQIIRDSDQKWVSEVLK